jgi:hypothetical protein
MGTSRGAVSWGLRVLVAGYVAVALLGTVVTSAYVVFVLGPAAGIAVAYQVALADVGFPRRPSARRAVLRSGAGGALLVPYLGAVVFLGSVGVVVSVVLVALCVLVAVPAASSVAQEAWRPYLVAPQGGDRQCEDVAGMSTTRLWQEWRSAHPRLHADEPRRALSALQRRASVLEELCRRDPTLVERWLEEGRLAPSWVAHRPVHR